MCLAWAYVNVERKACACSMWVVSRTATDIGVSSLSCLSNVQRVMFWATTVQTPWYSSTTHNNHTPNTVHTWWCKVNTEQLLVTHSKWDTRSKCDYFHILWTRASWYICVINTKKMQFYFEGCLSVHLPHEIKWNAKLLQLGNFIDVFLARHVSGTYAHHQEH